MADLYRWRAVNHFTDEAGTEYERDVLLEHDPLAEEIREVATISRTRKVRQPGLLSLAWRYLMAAFLALPLFGSTITYTASASGSGSAAVTYTEIVGPDPTPHAPPMVTESGNVSGVACPLAGSGCSLISFQNILPVISLPPGSTLVSASLQLFYWASSLSQGGLGISSVTPVDQSLPFTVGGAGSHGGWVAAVFSTDEGKAKSFGDFSTTIFPAATIDYTQAAQAALSSDGQLAPITAAEMIGYNFKTAQSASGGINAYTTFSEQFSVSGAHMDAVLSLNTAPTSVPESSSLVLVGIALVIACGAKLAHRGRPCGPARSTLQ